MDGQSARQPSRNAPCLNHASVNMGGAREGRKTEGEDECERMKDAAVETAMKLTVTVGADVAGPLCEII
ncbi:MAG: hypothetical protein JSS38_08510 [Nitrospira sp.]|nr:hypothetical protein [Nitrospira sp.]